MKTNNIKPICVIPARGGSKRIKNKNIINFFGKPLIYYSIFTALKSKLFSRVIVSTDSLKIKKISKKFGAEVPFLRKDKLSNDYATTKDVLLDAIARINSKKINYHCLLYPTAPLINSKTLVKAFNILKKEKADALMTVSKYTNHPLRSLYIKKKYLNFMWPKFQKKNSQDLIKLFHDTGSFYFFKTKKIINSKTFYPKKIIPYKLKIYETVDIDNYEDLALAKKLFKKK